MSHQFFSNTSPLNCAIKCYPLTICANLCILILVPQELLCRSSLETQKLELMAEVSSLKLKLASMEKDRLEFDERFGDSEVRKDRDIFPVYCKSSRWLICDSTIGAQSAFVVPGLTYCSLME